MKYGAQMIPTYVNREAPTSGVCTGCHDVSANNIGIGQSIGVFRYSRSEEPMIFCSNVKLNALNKRFCTPTVLVFNVYLFFSGSEMGILTSVIADIRNVQVSGLVFGLEC